MTHRLQRVYGIPGEAGQTLGQDDVDVSCLAFGQHFLKLIAGSGLCAADAPVREHPCVLPARCMLDERAVIADLFIQRMQQPFRRDGDAGVGGDAPGGDRGGCLSLDFAYGFCHGTPPPFGDITHSKREESQVVQGRLFK